jgi:hypothetical protein
MALPLPNVVANVGPGGPLVTSMNALNALENARHLTNINRVKSQYAPLTTQAEAASKLAYANLMAPQFLAKAMQNPRFMGNLSDEQKQYLNQLVYGAGTLTPNKNALNLIQGHTGIGQPSTNSLSGWLVNKFKNAFSHPQQQQLPQQPQAPAESALMQQGAQQEPDNIDHELDEAANAWFSTPEGQEQARNGTNPNPQDLIAWYRNQKNAPREMELNTGRKAEPTENYDINTGKLLGLEKQGEELGKFRAKAINDIGQSQLGLSHSGAVLDRLTGIITNPVFANMRKRIPGFQSKQLDVLKVMGTPEEKELIGDFLSTGESFIASTVQGFSGKPLVREFDLAQRQKITPHDTIDSATGKLRSARALHDIAEQKNQIVSELLQKGVNETDAVKKANKMIDVSAIERDTNARLQRKITIINRKTGDKKTVTIEEARKLGVPNV